MNFYDATLYVYYMKEREIYAVGRPSLENLTPNERKAFFSTLLMCVVEYYTKKEIKEEKPST